MSSINESMRKSISNLESQDKMNQYFKKQSSQQSLIKKGDNQEVSYAFSQVQEIQQEDNEDDIAIMQVFEKGDSSIIGAREKKKVVTHPPKLPTQKRPVSQKRPHQFNKLDDSEKEKVFLTVYDENLKIKETQRKQELYYSQMEVKFSTLDKQMKSFKNSIGSQGKHADIGRGQSQKDKEKEKDEIYQNLKYQNALKDQENEKLKQKLSALSQAHIVVQQNKAPRRKIMTSVNAQDPSSRQNPNVIGDGQVKDLLKLNDLFKKRCLEQESQIRSMQAMMNSKMVSNKDLTDKNSTFVTLKERYDKMEMHLQAQRNQLEDERKRQSEIMSLLRDEREKNHLLEQQVRSMELMTKSAQDLNDDLVEAKRQKYELEEKLKILMESPFFKDYNERATVQARVRTMENDLKLNVQDNKNLRDTNARLETENSIRRQENTDAQTELKRKYEECKEYQMQLNERDKQLAPFKDLNYWDNDQFLKVLGNLKWTGEDPAWRKIEFIDRTYLDSDDPNILRKEIEHLKLEKGELAAHLEKTQTLLRTRQDIEQQKEMLHKTEVDKLGLQLRAAIAKCSELAKIADLHVQSKQQRTMYEADGIKYSDSVSVFSVDPQEEDQLQPGENFFDLFLGDAELDQSGLMQSYAQAHPGGGSLDPSAMLTFLTIDFYDHETQHTSVAEGLRCQFNLQVSFKVLSDAPFIQYLESGYMKVELYMSQGSEAIRLATGLFSPRELVTMNQTEVCKVMAGTITLNGPNNQFIGIVSYKARMRQPISQIIKWLKDQKELDIQEQEEMVDIVAVRKRKLVIVIDKATQLPQRCSSFVYYSLDNKDFNTNTQPGSNPRWDYRMIHEIVFNEEFAHDLKRQKLELFLIDDNQPLTADGSSDKLGLCEIDLSPLLNGNVIDIATEIRNDDNQVSGRLFIKVFWYEQGRQDEAPTNNLIQQSWEESITNKIASQARSRGINSKQTFKLLDFDNDQIISFDDFQNGVRNILGLKLNQQEIQLYYQKLTQPLNQQNFDIVFRKVIGQEDQSMLTGQPELSKINQMINYNSQQLQGSSDKLDHVKKAINDVIQVQLKKGKSRNDIFKEIDSVRPDGYITLVELQGWLKYQGVKLPEDDVHYLISAYMDQDHDNKVNIKEFFNYILSVKNEEQQNRELHGRLTTSEQQYDIVKEALDSILEFASQNSHSMMKVREIMDEDRNGSIDRKEMMKFLQKCKLFLDDKDLTRVIEYFDTNDDGLISVQEFADALSQQNKSKKLLKTQNSFESVNDYVVGYLVSYMKKQNKSMPTLFNEIDENDDGYLSRNEMKDIFRKRIIVPLSVDEFDTFYKRFDQNGDNKISIKEFVGALQPAITRGEQQQQVGVGGGGSIQRGSQASLKSLVNPDKNIQQLYQRTEDAVTQHAKGLLDAFKQKEDARHHGYLTPATFRNILKQFNLGFNNNDIDKIIEDICQKNPNGLINYIKFVDLSRNNKPQVDLFDQTSYSAFGSMSQIEQERATLKTREIFQKIQKVVEKNNISSKQVFQKFDRDGNGKVDKVEMGKVFDEMRLKLTSEELDMIFATIDKNNKQYILIDELLKWMQPKK